MWESIILATSFRRRQLRKQFCASFAKALFHTAWVRKRLMHRSKTVPQVRPYQLKKAVIGNADLYSYSRQKTQIAPAHYPRFSSRLSLDTSENEHSDLRSIDQSPPLRYP